MGRNGGGETLIYTRYIYYVIINSTSSYLAQYHNFQTFETSLSSKIFLLALSKMKGITVASAAAPFTLVDGIAQPKPESHQILVKSLITAINPV